MSSGKKIIIGSISTLMIVIAIAAVIWLVTGDSANLPMMNQGEIDEITYQPQSTNVITNPYTDAPSKHTEATTAAPETTTKGVQTEVESYIENYLAEVSTYSQTVDTPTYEKPFFHVVTSGTVTDDNSLEGLTGVAKTVGQVILGAGFRYDKEQRIFYSETESWQRNFGFSAIYDAGAAFTGMYYDTMRLKFSYGGLDWMFQIWKGRYGITTGGEMGVYYKRPEHGDTFYACAKDDQMVTMSFALYRNDELFMTRGPEPHWWLTGFKIFEMAAPQELTMHATYFMDDTGMADALEASLKELGFVEGVNYQRLGLTMTIIWR